MSRRNSERMGSPMRSNASPAMAKPPEGFSFVIPTDYVDLPSQGQYYPEGHPLCGKETLEFKHMTAKEEDILTSKALLKKGVAIDKVLQNVIVDKTIDLDSLLVGDKNALIIALRAASYGNLYDSTVACPSCQEKVTYTFDLNEASVYHGDDVKAFDIVVREDGFFEVELPMTNLTIVFRLMTGKEERKYLKSLEQSGKNNQGDSLISAQLMAMIVSANGDDRLETRQYVSQNLPSNDSKHLRMAYKFANPNIDLTQNFECSNCGHEAEMEVPLSADFFWPNS